jgi:hypothetical protein
MLARIASGQDYVPKIYDVPSLVRLVRSVIFSRFHRWIPVPVLVPVPGSTWSISVHLHRTTTKLKYLTERGNADRRRIYVTCPGRTENLCPLTLTARGSG